MSTETDSISISPRYPELEGLVSTDPARTHRLEGDVQREQLAYRGKVTGDRDAGHETVEVSEWRLTRGEKSITALKVAGVTTGRPGLMLDYPTNWRELSYDELMAQIDRPVEP